MLGWHLVCKHDIQNAQERTWLVGLANGRVNCNKEPCPVPTCPHTAQNLNRHFQSHWEVSLQDREDLMAQLKRTVTIRMLAELRATNPMPPLRSTLDLEDPQYPPADPPHPEEPCAEAVCQLKIEGDLEAPQSPPADPPRPDKPYAEAVCQLKVDGDLEDPLSPPADPPHPEEPCAEAFCQLKVEGDLEAPHSPPANPPHPEESCAEAVCQLKVEGDLEAPQPPSAGPPHPDKPCAETVCQLKVEADLEDPRSPPADPPRPEEPCAQAFCRWQAEALVKAVQELDEKRALIAKLTQMYEALARKRDLDAVTMRRAKRARSTATTAPEEQSQVVVEEAPDPSSPTPDQRMFPDHIPSSNKLMAECQYHMPGGVRPKSKAKRRSAKPTEEGGSRSPGSTLDDDEAIGSQQRDKKPLPAIMPIKQLHLPITPINMSHLKMN
ncbi:unnamed protein product [Merluccius merluccius]